MSTVAPLNLGIAGLGRLVVEDPAKDVEVVDQHVLEDAARDFDIGNRRRTRVAARHDQHLRFADLTLVDARLQRDERRIVAPLKADQAAHVRLRNGCGACACPIQREIDRFLAEDVLPGCGRLEDQVRVGVGRRSDHHGLNRRIAHRRVLIGHRCAESLGEARRGLCIHVDDVLEHDAGLPDEIAAVDRADATGTVERDFEHDVVGMRSGRPRREDRVPGGAGIIRRATRGRRYGAPA